MIKYTSHILSFVLGGAICSSIVFYYLDDMITRTSTYFERFPYISHAKENIQIIEHINNGETEKAILKLESTIYSAKTILTNYCIDCYFELELEDLKLFSEYDYSEFSPKDIEQKMQETE